ncbi:MAG: hypothetical protein WBW04_14300 [Nitrolancea sp.]
MTRRGLRTAFCALLLVGMLAAVWSPTVVLAAAPSNDDFANRTAIGALTLPYTDTQDTTDATTEGSEPSSNCGTATNSIWYEFTPDISWLFMLSTAGSGYDTNLDVFTSSSTPATLTSLSSVNCNNDVSSPSDTTSFISMFMAAGTTYYIRVSSASGSGGSTSFSVIQRGSATSATATAGGNPYTLGNWTNQSPVTVTLSATYNDPPGEGSGSVVTDTMYSVDNGSFQTYTVPFDVTGQGMHTVQYYSEGSDGRTEPTHTAEVNIDLTAPTTSASATVDANAYTFGDWTNQDVIVTLAASDTGGSGVANTFYEINSGSTQTYSTPFTITTEGIYTVTYWSTDNAGNVETSQTATVKIDKSGPTISGSPTTSPNGNGWYNSDVTVQWTCSDPDLVDSNPGSGVATCPSDSAISTEGTGLTASGTATDNAGNSTTVSSSPAVNIDKTAPTITYTGNQGFYTVDETVNITCSATDSLSGIDTTDCQDITGPAYSFNLGHNSFSSTATDKAGNVGTGSVEFDVGVTTDSLIALTNEFASNQFVAYQLTAPLRSLKTVQALHFTGLSHFFISLYQTSVNLQRGRGLTNEQADLLIQLSNQLQ